MFNQGNFIWPSSKSPSCCLHKDLNWTSEVILGQYTHGQMDKVTVQLAPVCGVFCLHLHLCHAVCRVRARNSVHDDDTGGVSSKYLKYACFSYFRALGNIIADMRACRKRCSYLAFLVQTGSSYLKSLLTKSQMPALQLITKKLKFDPLKLGMRSHWPDIWTVLYSLYVLNLLYK